MKSALFIVSLILAKLCSAQYAGAAGTSNSTAIWKDSAILVAWATNCTIERGLIDITDVSSGPASFGQDSDGIGPADLTGIVSLGDSGVAILSFANGIFNGPGPDFAIYENSFSDSFLELAHVEVSSDGINFFRFQSDFLQSIPQIGAFDELSNPEKINNLAGKYRQGFGTPFNLDEMIGIFGLNVNNITHIKIIDAVGSVSAPHGSTDQNGNYINDPFPTPFPSSGFDLDAVGVIYQIGVNNLDENQFESLFLYPNPVRNVLTLSSEKQIERITIYDIHGSIVQVGTETEIDFRKFSNGLYLLQIKLQSGQIIQRKICKN